MRGLFSSMFLALALFSLCAGAPVWGAEEPARRDYIMGTGNNAGGLDEMWEDPETGDIVHNVIAPRAPHPSDAQQWPPIFVYPEVTPQWPPTQRHSPGAVWPSPMHRQHQR